ncbi:MAG: hypothetical protein ABSB71_08445 [Candidatus Bathyarchaeia archaeon]
MKTYPASGEMPRDHADFEPSSFVTRSSPISLLKPFKRILYGSSHSIEKKGYSSPT